MITKQLLRDAADGIGSGRYRLTDHTYMCHAVTYASGDRTGDTAFAFHNLLREHAVDISGDLKSSVYPDGIGRAPTTREAIQAHRFDFLNLLAESL